MWWWLVFYDSTYKWNHVVSVFLCLISLSIVPSRSVHVVVACHRTSSFLWLKNVPFCMQHIVCIYSSADEHLGRSTSWLLWLMLQGAWRCHYLFVTVLLFPLDKCPEVKLLHHMVVLFLIFWRTSVSFSKVAIPVCIPPHSAEGFPFLHALTSTCDFFVFLMTAF